MKWWVKGFRGVGARRGEEGRTSYVTLILGRARDCCGADDAGYGHTMVSLCQCWARSGEARTR